MRGGTCEAKGRLIRRFQSARFTARAVNYRKTVQNNPTPVAFPPGSRRHQPRSPSHGQSPHQARGSALYTGVSHHTGLVPFHPVISSQTSTMQVQLKFREWRLPAVVGSIKENIKKAPSHSSVPEVATRASLYWRKGARVFALAILDFWCWRLLSWIQSVDSNHSALWGEKRHVLRLSSKPSVSCVAKNQSFIFKLRDVLTQTLLVIFYSFIFWPTALHQVDSQRGHMSGCKKNKKKKNANEPSLLIRQFFCQHIYSPFNREGIFFYHRYTTLNIDRPLNKEKQEITADLSLPSCQPLNHPPSGEKPGSNMTTADSLSVSPLWPYEVRIAKKHLEWHSGRCFVSIVADKHCESWTEKVCEKQPFLIEWLYLIMH